MMPGIILFTSNCFGEDRSAALIARELNELLLRHGKDYRVMGASLISEGKDYTSRNIELLYSSSVPPSGGFPLRSLRGFLADLFSGSVGNIFRFIRKLKSHREEIELVVVVGDVSLLILTNIAVGKKPTIFLSLPKSDYIEPHYAIEEWYCKHHADEMLTRDKITAEHLARDGVQARFLGNPLMDELECTTSLLPWGENDLVLALLPGSREEAYDNLVMMLDVVREVWKKKSCHVVVAFPSTLSDERMKEKASPHGWRYREATPFPVLEYEGREVVLSRGIFPEVLHKATVVLGLAGTANEQAAGLGKPVVAFQGTGPQTTHKRFVEQGKLLGDALAYCRYPDEVVGEILFLFDHPEERKKRGLVGKEHMGASGGSKAIAEYLFHKYLK